MSLFVDVSGKTLIKNLLTSFKKQFVVREYLNSRSINFSKHFFVEKLNIFMLQTISEKMNEIARFKKKKRY